MSTEKNDFYQGLFIIMAYSDAKKNIYTYLVIK